MTTNPILYALAHAAAHDAVEATIDYYRELPPSAFESLSIARELAADILKTSKEENPDCPLTVLERPRVQALAKAAEKLADRVAMLSSAVDRDRTGLAAALAQIITVAQGYQWVAWGRGSYEFDDERYRSETGRALDSIIAGATHALRRSGDLATSALRCQPLPEQGKPVPLSVVVQGLLIDEARVIELIGMAWDDARPRGEDGAAGIFPWRVINPDMRKTVAGAVAHLLRTAVAASLDETAQASLPGIHA